MQVVFNEDGGVITALLPGRLDTVTSSEVGEVLMAKLNGCSEPMVIDLEETVFISSAGLRVLLKCAKFMKQQNRKLALCRANEQNFEVLEISGFLTIMEHYEQLEEAFHAVQS